MIPIVLVLQFISGVYLQFTQLPEWMQNIASLFPLKWMAQGMRSVFLPEDFEALEQNGSWDLAWVAIALLASGSSSGSWSAGSRSGGSGATREAGGATREAGRPSAAPAVRRPLVRG